MGPMSLSAWVAMKWIAGWLAGQVDLSRVRVTVDTLGVWWGR